MDQQEVLHREFLEIRARLLQVAASLDRIDRAEGSLQGDRRREQIQKAIQALSAGNPSRAEAIQLIFSLPYDENWRASFGLDGPTQSGSPTTSRK
jgi:hypothetical protein